MNSRRAGSVVPNVVFGQTNDGLDSWKQENEFVYDLAYPQDYVDSEEALDIIEEVMIDDVYRLQKITNHGDVWVDAGSHIGLFSIAAMQAGARVHAAIEANPDVASCCRYNCVMFKGQSVARGLIGNRVVDPFIVNEKIIHAGQLLNFNINGFHDDVVRRCLKLDIQKSEIDVFKSEDAFKLASQYELLVLEYHDEITSDISILLESNGWNIINITAHRDTLLNIPTNLVWAESG